MKIPLPPPWSIDYGQGFLPGDLDDKLALWAKPIYKAYMDNLEALLGNGMVRDKYGNMRFADEIFLQQVEEGAELSNPTGFRLGLSIASNHFISFLPWNSNSQLRNGILHYMKKYSYYPPHVLRRRTIDDPWESSWSG